MGALARRGYDFGNVTVLVADDSLYMRAIIKVILTGLGFVRIFEAEDGAEAFRVFRGSSVDVALIDWEMPILNGIEFVRMIRTSDESPNPFAPLIMVSGHSERRRVVEARDAGVNEFIVKPVSAQLVYSRLVSVIERPRPFIRVNHFFGPDRRRRRPDSFRGNERRQEILEQLEGFNAEALSQDDVDGVIYKDK